MNLKDELIDGIYNKMKCDNIFDKGLIEKAVEGLDPKQYLEFYKELFGEGFDFAKGLDRVEIVSKRFKDKNELPLIEAVKSEAQALSDSLLLKSNACVDYASKHRDKFENDLIFFMNVDFEAMYKPETKLQRQDNLNYDAEAYFTKRELEVIYDLGRDWFYRISSLNNFGEVVKAVERSLANEHKLAQGLIHKKVKELMQ